MAHSFYHLVQHRVELSKPMDKFSLAALVVALGHGGY